MRTRSWLGFALLLALVVASAALAQSGGGYDLTWSTIDGGGVLLSAGGAYSMSGTMGQPDAGVLQGGSYTLTGGFWSASPAERVYLPLVMRNH